MKTYRQWRQILEQELEELGGRPFLLPFRAMCRGLMQDSRTVDEAVRVFAITRLWPPLAELDRLEVCCRLACVLEWLSIPDSEDENEERDDRVFVEDLMIEYWRDAGQWNWVYDELILPVRRDPDAKRRKQS